VPGEVEATERLLSALTALRTTVQDARLPLDLPGAAQHRRTARRLVEHLDDYLLPRVRQMGAPLLAVVGGSTGAGKSTLVNSLVGGEVTASGVLRPTTRSPVLVHHPDDTAWFATDRILPTLPRVTGREAQGRALRLVAHVDVPRGLAILDAPDIDSVVEENRELGEELLGAADLWVFVTTAARYADAVPWDLLAAAARRRAVVTVVLNRVDPPARTAVAADLGRMLTENGLPEARLVAVEEATLVDGRLPRAAVAELDAWLRAVVGDSTAREQVVHRTVAGAVEDLLASVPALASAVDEHVAHAGSLRSLLQDAYDDARARVEAATSDGTMLRGEVLARWQEFVGTGEIFRAIEARVSNVRDRVTAFVRGRPAPEPVAEAISSGLVDLVVDAADRAAERTAAAWRADPAGTRLVEGLWLTRASSDLRGRVAEQVREWQRGVLDLVSSEGADKRSTARVLSFGVNALGATLMVVIFASTGGLTTAEVGVAGGTAVLAQRLLEAVFGDEAVRRLTRTAHADLVARFDRLLDDEARRFATVVDALDLAPAAGERLRAAAHQAADDAAWLGAVVELPPVLSGPGERADDVRTDPVPEESGVRRWWRSLWEG
jgi:hypothetical protein